MLKKLRKKILEQLDNYVMETHYRIMHSEKLTLKEKIDIVKKRKDIYRRVGLSGTYIDKKLTKFENDMLFLLSMSEISSLASEIRENLKKDGLA